MHYILRNSAIDFTQTIVHVPVVVYSPWAWLLLPARLRIFWLFWFRFRCAVRELVHCSSRMTKQQKAAILIRCLANEIIMQNCCRPMCTSYTVLCSVHQLLSNGLDANPATYTRVHLSRSVQGRRGGWGICARLFHYILVSLNNLYSLILFHVLSPSPYPTSPT